MKFGIYTHPSTNLDIRCIDGEFTYIHPSSYRKYTPGTPAYWNAILNAPSRPATAEILHKLASSGSLCTYSRAIARTLYSVPDDVELYEWGDFGVELAEAKEAKTERLQIRITPKLKAELQVLADAEGRTVSNYIEQLIKAAVNKQSDNA